MTKHKYKVGQIVWWRDDWYEIIQLRVDNGNITYRLDDGSRVNEDFLTPR